MDERTRQEIANFRYGLIAAIVSRPDLAFGEQMQLLREIAAREYRIPDNDKIRVSIRTLERFLALYRKGGLEALMPISRKDSGCVKRIPEEVLTKATLLRKERPERSVEQIIRILEWASEVEPGILRPSTLSRHLNRLGLSRKEVLDEQRERRRFGATDINCLWQGDCQHTLYLSDPVDPAKKRKVYLIAWIDDYSRYLPAACFYWEEKLPRLEDCLKRAIIRCGVPERIYVDNGAIYSTHHLKRVCGRLGIQLSHSRPYQPAGRGKIERMFRFVDTSFKPEAYQLIEQGKLTTLGQLNQKFWAWLEFFYHKRRHGTTKSAPAVLFAQSNKEIKRVPIDTLNEIFLWEEERKVDKVGCVSVLGNIYEVDTSLVGKRVSLRFDPYDLRDIQVWHQEKRYDNARVLDLNKERHPKAPREVPNTKDDNEGKTPTGLNFLDLAERKHRQEQREKIGAMTFTKLATSVTLLSQRYKMATKPVF